MIFDTLDQYNRYAGLGNPLQAAFKYLTEHDLDTLPLGRTEIDGDTLFALVQEYSTKPVDQGQWEAHRRYMDLQYMHKGTERMGFANLRTLQAGEYVPEKDFLPLVGSGNFVDVFAGAFVIFYPEDGHMPGLCAGSPEPVRKIVLKVKVEA